VRYDSGLMATAKILTAPEPTKGMPRGIPYIIGNEAAERFSYYGMRTILVVFMTQYLLGADGSLDVMTKEEAKGWYHLFGSAVYALPALGAIISDAWWGKYNTILRVSIIYCLGHLALALDETRLGLTVGLTLIAIGSGGIKPCVTAHVGDQFGKENQHLLDRVIGWFYFSINFGSFFATLLTPWLLKVYGPHVAFGLPGLLMLVATGLFWKGRTKYAHIPPKGMGFVKEAFSPAGLRAIGKLVLLMLFLAPYYALFEQQGSSWILQAKKMDLSLPIIGELLPSQVHAANPLLVMLYVPLFEFVLYPAVGKFVTVTPLRKIGSGFFLVAASFVVCAHVETLILAGERPTIWWQLLAYALMTAGEVLVSVTSLAFFYTQAPLKMKSAIMSVKMFAVSLGNLVTAGVNFLIMSADGETSKLPGASYYLFFVGMMMLTALLFIPMARAYNVNSFMQDVRDS
jgi:proton-dependent oligopeptide transporter, POT family